MKEGLKDYLVALAQLEVIQMGREVIGRFKKQTITVFLDCLSTIFKTGPVFSKHYTQLAQPHTQLAKHYRSFAKLNTLVKTIHFFLKTTLCYHMKHTRFTLLYSVCTSYTLL